MEELDINIIKILLLAYLIFTLSSCVGTAAEIHVQPGGSIQAAVNSAKSDDTIIVEPGTYTGNIDISRDYANNLNNLVLMASSSNPGDTIIVADNTAGPTVKGVISIKYKTHVTIKGFTITGARNDVAGVYLSQGKQCTVENNIFLNDGLGVKLTSFTDSVVRNNNFNRTSTFGTGTAIDIEQSGNTMVSGNSISNQNNGIHIVGSNSKGSTISRNSISQNTNSGILMESAKGVTLEGNTLNSNKNDGIYLSFSDENNLTNNNVLMLGSAVNGTNTNGINLYHSKSNTISNNNASSADHGIFFNTCENNVVQNNKVSSNLYGIAMRYSHKNKIINNNADGNKEGIYLTWEDSGNTISGNNANLCDVGIHLTNYCGKNNLVDNNIAKSNTFYGIYVETNNNVISNNHATGNSRGIYLLGSGCYNNTLSNNIVDFSTGNGIRLANTSNYNKLFSNSLISNSGDGIYLVNSNNSYIDSNTARGNNIGIHVESSNKNILSSNVAPYNNMGIRLYSADNNTLSNNTVSYNALDGIDLNSAVSNNITGNHIIWNEKGIFLCPKSINNQIYNNYFNNTENTDAKNARCTWHIGKTKGKNVVGGPYIGGNFWAHINGDGFSQTAHDSEGNGIADAIYDKEVNVIDSSPLVSVVLPVADFRASTTQGYAPLDVQLTDLSQNAISRIWDFGDGTNSTEQNPKHTYSKAGNYTVNFIVSDKNNTISKATTITVLDYNTNPTTGPSISSSSDSDGSSSSSFSSGSSSESAGLGSSNEPQSNVVSKEISQAFITSGKSVKFDFPQNATSVVYVSFDSKKTTGKTPTIVEMLKEKSILASGLPSDAVYKHLNIWVGNNGFATQKNLENAVLCFKVEKFWIQDNKIDQSSISLNRYCDKEWNPLPTIKSGEDNKYLYFTAQTPGFSPFVITGKMTAKQNTPVNTPVNVEHKSTDTTGMPGFEIISCITVLLAVFLYKRK
jgi:PGF-pre-PGF domain-containing protein